MTILPDQLRREGRAEAVFLLIARRQMTGLGGEELALACDVTPADVRAVITRLRGARAEPAVPAPPSVQLLTPPKRRGGRPGATPEVVASAVRLVGEGLTCAEIAALLGVSPATAWRILRGAGVEMRRGRRPRSVVAG